jgi:hypothetical protein
MKLEPIDRETLEAITRSLDGSYEKAGPRAGGLIVSDGRKALRRIEELEKRVAALEAAKG